MGTNGSGSLRGFSRFTRTIARAAGRGVVFACAAGLVLAWALAGPFLGFSTGWQLTINTATTIVTFLMVFIIQNTQTRDTEAIQIKLDELLRANGQVSNEMLDLEDLPEAELMRLQRQYAGMAEEARQRERRVASVKQEVADGKRAPPAHRHRPHRAARQHASQGASARHARRRATAARTPPARAHSRTGRVRPRHHVQSAR